MQCQCLQVFNLCSATMAACQYRLGLRKRVRGYNPGYEWNRGLIFTALQSPGKGLDS